MQGTPLKSPQSALSRKPVMRHWCQDPFHLPALHPSSACPSSHGPLLVLPSTQRLTVQSSPQLSFEGAVKESWVPNFPSDTAASSCFHLSSVPTAPERLARSFYLEGFADASNHLLSEIGVLGRTVGSTLKPLLSLLSLGDHCSLSLHTHTDRRVRHGSGKEAKVTNCML